MHLAPRTFPCVPRSHLQGIKLPHPASLQASWQLWPLLACATAWPPANPPSYLGCNHRGHLGCPWRSSSSAAANDDHSDSTNHHNSWHHNYNSCHTGSFNNNDINSCSYHSHYTSDHANNNNKNHNHNHDHNNYNHNNSGTRSLADSDHHQSPVKLGPGSVGPDGALSDLHLCHCF